MFSNKIKSVIVDCCWLLFSGGSDTMILSRDKVVVFRRIEKFPYFWIGAYKNLLDCWLVRLGDFFTNSVTSLILNNTNTQTTGSEIFCVSPLVWLIFFQDPETWPKQAFLRGEFCVVRSKQSHLSAETFWPFVLVTLVRAASYSYIVATTNNWQPTDHSDYAG